MTLPTKQWFPTSITGGLGSYQAWNLNTIDAETMIRALVTVLKPFLKTNGSFDNITIYTQATATSPNIPQASLAISEAGTGGATDEAAVSATWNFKTLANGNGKITVLDSPILATWFNRILPVNFNAAQIAVALEYGYASNAWSGRDDSQPLTVRSITYDLNDKLQRAYFK